jgi:hypothetical protein
VQLSRIRFSDFLKLGMLIHLLRLLGREFDRPQGPCLRRTMHQRETRTLCSSFGIRACSSSLRAAQDVIGRFIIVIGYTLHLSFLFLFCCFHGLNPLACCYFELIQQEILTHLIALAHSVVQFPYWLSSFAGNSKTFILNFVKIDFQYCNEGTCTLIAW